MHDRYIRAMPSPQFSDPQSDGVDRPGQQSPSYPDYDQVLANSGYSPGPANPDYDQVLAISGYGQNPYEQSGFQQEPLDPAEQTVAMPPTMVQTPRSKKLGKTALLIGIIAAGLSIVASGVFGGVGGSLQAEHGDQFATAVNWFQPLTVVLLCIQVLCALLGLAGLIMGIVAAATNRGRVHGIIAAAIVIIGPAVSFGAYVIISIAAVAIGGGHF